MKVAEVRATIRKNLGNYEHEEFTAVIVSDEDSEDTADEMMAEARRICVQHTTAYLKAVKEKQNASR